MKTILSILTSSMIAFALEVSATPVTYIKMSSIGAYVVPKGSYYYDDNNSTITGSNSYSSNQTYFQNSPTFRVNYDDGSSFGGYWNLSFSTHELGGPMTLGRYDNAVRFPFEPNNTPGLSITGNGRGNNTLTGSFEVFDIAYSGNTLLRFAATFEQNNSIFGEISYNSDAIPEPSSLFSIFVAGGIVVFARRRILI